MAEIVVECLVFMLIVAALFLILMLARNQFCGIPYDRSAQSREESHLVLDILSRECFYMHSVAFSDLTSS
jgi:hypothetical protein